MPRRRFHSGWVWLWTAAAAGFLGAGCGRSIGFGSFGLTNGFDVGGSGGGSGIGSGGHSGSAGFSSGGSGGSNGVNGTAGSNGGVAGLTNGGATGTPGNGTSAGSMTGTGTGFSATGGGSSTGICVPGPTPALSPCSSDADCLCSFRCVPETGGSICEQICMTTNDCPDLETLCQSGTCALNLCGAHGVGPQNGNLDSTCDALGKNDGSCIPQSLNNMNVGLCSQGGQAQSGCNPLATRTPASDPDLSEVCKAGDVCLLLSGKASCFRMCDHLAHEPCGPGMDCIVPLSSNSRLGICEPASAATTGGSASSGGNGNGTSGGGTGGDAGDCSESASIEEFQDCDAPSDCACPLVCNRDSLQRVTGSVCEYPCSSGCPDPLTICSDSDGGDGICITNGCGAETGNGSFNSTCNVKGTDDGTCEPELLGDSSVGWCFLGGTAGFDAGDCNLLATSSDTTELCPAGSLCFGVITGSCNPLCDPNTGTGCPTGSFCSGIVDQPDLGVCIGGF